MTLVLPAFRSTGARAARPVLVGFSGGLDSTVLLHLLAASPAQRAAGLRAVHVNHQLQAQADAWALHCQRSCDALGVPLSIIRVDVDRGGGLGLEGAARQARHAAFAGALAPDEVLALAHHQDDQAETFLLRALRGAGTDGLAAMRPWRPYSAGWLWRPLLAQPRAAMLAHAREHGLDWIEDPSNADTGLDRAWLRAHVLPALRQRWPQASASLARSASLSGASADLLGNADAAALATAATLDPQVLDTNPLLTLVPAARARVLRRWVASLGLPPLPAHGVQQVEAMLIDVRADAAPCFDWAGTRIQRWGTLLHAGPVQTPAPADWCVHWDGRAPLQLPDGSSLSLLGADALPATMQVHARRGGERIHLPGCRHSHALKHVLQQLQVPRWERELLPLLSNASGQLQAAGDLAYSAAFGDWLRANGAGLRWQRRAARPLTHAAALPATDD